MSGYLINFVVYTAAMTGIIFLALFVYKKVSEGYKSSSRSKFLNIDETINLAPRKNLYIISAGKERFLIASDAERTSLISKLDENSSYKINEKPQISQDIQTVVDFPKSKPATVFQNIMKQI